MKHDVIGGKTFWFPDGKQRVDGDPVAVDDDGHCFFPFLVVLAVNVGGKPAFNPPALIVIGASAALAVVFTGFKTIYVEIPHIGTDPVEPFHKFWKFFHGIVTFFGYSLAALRKSWWIRCLIFAQSTRACLNIHSSEQLSESNFQPHSGMSQSLKMIILPFFPYVTRFAPFFKWFL